MVRRLAWSIVCTCFSIFLWGQETKWELDPFHLYDIQIRIEVPNWEKRLTAYRASRRLDKIPATVWIDGEQRDSVGLRFKGNSSYNRVKKDDGRKLPFTMKSNEYLKGAEFLPGLNNLKLSNGFRDPSYLRDVMSFYIARQFMPAPQCALARVTINDEYFGVYTLTQDIGKRFLEDHFNEHKGVFVKCDPDWTIKAPKHCKLSDHSSLEYIGDDPECYTPNYELKSEQGWKEFITFVKNLNNPKIRPETLLEVDLALWMHAFNMVLVNLDSYTGRLCHNYFLYRHREELFVPLIWDLNLSFGGFRMLDKDNLSDKELIELSPFVQKNNPRRPLINTLLDDPLLRKTYLAHSRTILDSFFVNDRYKSLIGDWQKLIMDHVKAEQMSLYDYDSFQKNRKETVLADGAPIIGLEQLMEARTAWLKDHPLWRLEAPVFVGLPSMETTLDSTYILRITMRGTDGVHLYYREAGQLGYHHKVMEYERVGGAGGAVYAAVLPKGEGLELYMVAENEEAARAWPAGASYAPFHLQQLE